MKGHFTLPFSCPPFHFAEHPKIFPLCPPVSPIIYSMEHYFRLLCRNVKRSLLLRCIHIKWLEKTCIYMSIYEMQIKKITICKFSASSFLILQVGKTLCLSLKPLSSCIFAWKLSLHIVIGLQIQIRLLVITNNQTEWKFITCVTVFQCKS